MVLLPEVPLCDTLGAKEVGFNLPQVFPPTPILSLSTEYNTQLALKHIFLSGKLLSWVSHDPLTEVL